MHRLVFSTRRGSAVKPLLDGGCPFFARRSMALCYTTGKLVFFGGVGAAGTESILDVSADCWTFDPHSLTWREIPRHGDWPSPRRCVGMAPTPTGLLLWGGSGITDTPTGTRYTFLNDWWRFELATGQWSMLSQSGDHQRAPENGQDGELPSPRYTPVFLSLADTLFLFGGYTEDSRGKRKLNDAWMYEDAKWSRVDETGPTGYAAGASWPGPRYGCMFASFGRKAFVFGGFSDAGDHNDLWEFDAGTHQWRLLSPESSSEEMPLARYCGAFAYDQRKLFLFGGRSRRNARANYNDLWTFDLDHQRWDCLTPNRLPHRYDASASFPAYHAKASSAVAGGDWYIWGGEGARGHVSDFWRLSFSTFEWELVQAARPDDPVFW